MKKKPSLKIEWQNKPLGWIIYLIVMLFFNLIWFSPPILMSVGQEDIAMPIYYGLSFTCHQLDTRSICYFPEADMIIKECKPVGLDNADYSRAVDHFDEQGNHGYKFGVCSRDIAIYAMMFLGAILWPIFFRLDEDIWPPVIWLIISIIPVALDGGTQFIGLRESTNLLRLITGSMMGIGMSFYIIPTLNQILNQQKKK
jgi:uncharacterized membrane protein